MKAFCFLICIFSSLQANAQALDFPTGLSGYRDRPETQLWGKVHTILTVSYKNDKFLNTSVELFDSQERMLEFMSQSVDVEVHSDKLLASPYRRRYFYDSKGKGLNLILHYGEDGKLSSRTTFTYNSKGQLYKETSYLADDSLNTENIYAYNPEEMSVTISYTSFYKDRYNKQVSIPDKTLLLYNKKGQWIKRIRFDKEDKQKDSVSFEYDNKGFISKEIACCTYNYLNKFEYKVDSKGNWIERTEISVQKENDGKINYYEVGKVYRVISYHEDRPNK